MSLTRYVIASMVKALDDQAKSIDKRKREKIRLTISKGFSIPKQTVKHCIRNVSGRPFDIDVVKEIFLQRSLQLFLQCTDLIGRGTE